MRLMVFLSILCAVAVPAQARQAGGVSGIHFNIAGPMAAPAYDNSAIVPGLGSRSVNVGRAQQLIAAGRYAQADSILSKMIGQTSSKQVRFLKGVAKLGMGDAVAARRYFERSLYIGGNGHPGAMSGLALAEIRLGNREAAETILGKLRYQQDKCGIDCDRARALDQAVAVVEKALI